MQYYGINEIYKKKLLQSRNGTPYKTKISIRQVVNTLPYTIKLSKFGDMKCLTLEQINEYNKQYETKQNTETINEGYSNVDNVYSGTYTNSN